MVFVELVTAVAWPALLFCAGFVFKDQIRAVLESLSERKWTASAAGVSISADARQQRSGGENPGEEKLSSTPSITSNPALELFEKSFDKNLQG